jgi:hypothetical protein
MSREFFQKEQQAQLKEESFQLINFIFAGSANNLFSAHVFLIVAIMYSWISLIFGGRATCYPEEC